MSLKRVSDTNIRDQNCILVGNISGYVYQLETETFFGVSDTEKFIPDESGCYCRVIADTGIIGYVNVCMIMSPDLMM